VPFRTDALRRAGFVVLRAPDTPAVLLEMGYLSNKDDVKRLTSPQGRAAIAVATSRAVEIHFARQSVAP
jgi:N-acetylmuramoyl-L-alanine amidase